MAAPKKKPAPRKSVAKKPKESLADTVQHNAARILYATNDLSTQEFANGWKVVFQRSTVTSLVRAVMKTDTGEIWTRGSVVPEERALESRLEAISLSKKRNYNRSLGLGPNASKEEIEDAILNQIPGLDEEIPGLDDEEDELDD